MPGQVAQDPPAGVLGYVVLVPGARVAFYTDKHEAERYAARMNTVAWPVVAAKRKDE